MKFSPKFPPSDKKNSLKRLNTEKGFPNKDEMAEKNF